jgi:uncharacterized protein YbjT (DUF2867 family)
MILVTSATSLLGRELVKELQGRGVAFKAMVRREEARAAFAARNVEAVVADFSQPETLCAAMEGVDTVFLKTPLQPGGPRLEAGFLAAALAAGVGRVVRLSAMGADPGAASPLARGHGQGEAQLEASGLAWTCLRPALLMQDLGPLYGDSVAATSSVFAPAGDARIPWVDARDVAALAAVALTAEGHESLVYEVTGPELHTYAGLAELLSVHLGRTVRFVDVPDDAAFHCLGKLGMSPWQAHGFITLFHIYRANGPTALVLGTFARITGRPPRTLQAYLTENLNLFRGIHSPLIRTA